MSGSPAPGVAGSERKAWYVVFVLFLAYTLSFIDRQILTLMVDPIRQDLGLSDTQFSLLHGLAFAIFYTLLGLPMGWIADRFSRVRLIAVGVAMWSVMTATCGVARDYTALFISRMGVGVGEATLSPAAYSMMADLFSKERLPRAVSTYSMGIATGAGLAMLVGGQLVTHIESMGSTVLPVLGAIRPWQLVFLLLGLLGLPLALLIVGIREPRRQDVSRQDLRVRDVAAFIAARKRLFLTFLPGISIATALSHGIGGWTPAYFMRTHGWTAAEVGTYYGAGVLICGIAGLHFGSWLAESLQRRGHVDAPLRAAAIGIAIATPVGAAAALTGNATVSLALFVLLQFALYMPWGVVGAAIQLIAPNEMRGQLSALYLFSINLIGLGIGPTFVAILSDRLYGGGAGVGPAIATTAATLGTISVVLLASAFGAYRVALQRAQSWYSS